MTTILLVIQVFIVLALICVILLQKTGSDSLAGLSSGGNNAFSSKSASGIFTKTTIFLAMAFIVNSLLIVKITKDAFLASNKSILEHIEVEPKQEKAPEPLTAPKVEE